MSLVSLDGRWPKSWQAAVLAQAADLALAACLANFSMRIPRHQSLFGEFLYTHPQTPKGCVANLSTICVCLRSCVLPCEIGQASRKEDLDVLLS
jgi:hypothetical protein